MLFKILTFAGDSSVGRAVDCRSIGRVFDSPSLDLIVDVIIQKSLG